MKTPFLNQRGFTGIEVVMVIALIGIITAATMSFLGRTAKDGYDIGKQVRQTEQQNRAADSAMIGQLGSSAYAPAVIQQSVDQSQPVENQQQENLSPVKSAAEPVIPNNEMAVLVGIILVAIAGIAGYEYWKHVRGEE